MNERSNKWRSFSWHCPNCGKPVTAFQGCDGTIKLDCPKCRSTMVRREMGRRHKRIDIYAPEERALK